MVHLNSSAQQQPSPSLCSAGLHNPPASPSSAKKQKTRMAVSGCALCHCDRTWGARPEQLNTIPSNQRTSTTTKWDINRESLSLCSHPLLVDDVFRWWRGPYLPCFICPFVRDWQTTHRARPDQHKSKSSSVSTWGNMNYLGVIWTFIACILQTFLLDLLHSGHKNSPANILGKAGRQRRLAGDRGWCYRIVLIGQ